MANVLGLSSWRIIETVNRCIPKDKHCSTRRRPYMSQEAMRLKKNNFQTLRKCCSTLSEDHYLCSSLR